MNPKTGLTEGLTTNEVHNLQKKFGPNATPDTTPAPWRRALAKFWAPVPCMLEAAIVLQVTLGERLEAAIIAALLVFNAALGFFQEERAQKTLQALKSRLALNASVRRNGTWQTVPVADLVPGDIVKLTLGGIVGADVSLISGSVLLDQSMLTGESLPVEAGAGFQTYAGAIIRRGEAVAEVTATGTRTKFGRTIELVRTAYTVGTQQKAVMRVVRNLVLFNGTIVCLQVVYALKLGMQAPEIIPLILTALLATIPVALPATFTLATALGARMLARRGVLLTRLSALDEAATMDVLCVDKTGTLTQNELSVTAIRAMPGFNEQQVLALAALASAEGGLDPVDSTIRQAAVAVAGLPQLIGFVPFDPAKKMSEALTKDADGRTIRIVKGAFKSIDSLAQSPLLSAETAKELEMQGYRVLAVAAGESSALNLIGLIALSDPPRSDSAALIADLLALGVHTTMVTGDASATAATVAHAVGLEGAICPPGPIPDKVRPGDFAVFAGVLPEDKYKIVKAFQTAGHTVGMCGDGANDAPALRLAQMGIAVSTATDVAKSAAGIVLTEPGLGGIVAAVQEGRITFQRILTYTLRSLTNKIYQLLFLAIGLVMTGHAILTPMLLVLLLITGDFLSMSSTTDNVRPSPKPNVWRINNLTMAAIIMGACNLFFCSSVLAIGKFHLGFNQEELQSLAAITLVFSGQAVLYVVRERHRIWNSRPSVWFMLSSIADLMIIATLAISGTLMAALPVSVVGAVLAAAVIFAFVLDNVKLIIFRRFKMI